MPDVRVKNFSQDDVGYITKPNKEIKIKYFNRKLHEIEKIEKGDWIDLRCAEDEIVLRMNEFKLIPLGVAMQLPEGYEAHIVPRSSTFKNFGIIQTNHCGIVDESYCGDNDQWYFPALCLEKYSTILLNDRICQFRIVEKQPGINFQVEPFFNNPDRGGLGSTGIK